MQKIKDEYAIAYKQILAILNYIPIEEYRKIPIEKIRFYRHAAKKDYDFVYNVNKTFEEQNISKITESLLAGLYRDYWASDIQRERIINRQNYERKKLGQIKNEGYSIEKIFKQRNEMFGVDNETNTQLSVVNESSFIKKIINKLKSLFH